MHYICSPGQMNRKPSTIFDEQYFDTDCADEDQNDNDDDTGCENEYDSDNGDEGDDVDSDDDADAMWGQGLFAAISKPLSEFQDNQPGLVFTSQLNDHDEDYLDKDYFDRDYRARDYLNKDYLDRVFL